MKKEEEYEVVLGQSKTLVCDLESLPNTTAGFDVGVKDSHSLIYFDGTGMKTVVYDPFVREKTRKRASSIWREVHPQVWPAYTEKLLLGTFDPFGKWIEWIGTFNALDHGYTMYLGLTATYWRYLPSPPKRKKKK